MLNKEQQEKIFSSIGKELKKPMQVYAIGGTSMMLRGAKENTLDIDLVFLNSDDRKIFLEAVGNLGFKNENAIKVYGLKENVPLMVNVLEGRIDLFLEKIITSTFSDNMKKRANETHEFGTNLLIKPADLNDVLIMKSATSRAKDEDDIVSIINKSQINWDVILEEVQSQIKLGNQLAIIGLGEVLERIHNKKFAPVPKSVLDSLWVLLNKQINEKSGKEKKEHKLKSLTV